MKPDLSVVVPILGYDSIGTFMQTLQVAWSGSIEVIILDSSRFGERHDTVNYDESGKSTLVRAIIDPPIPHYQALNMGVRAARGEYIAVVHDDVLFGHLSLENCVHAIDRFELPCVFPRNTFGPAQVEQFEAEGKKVAQQPLELAGSTCPPPCCTVFSSDIFDLIGWFDDRFEFFYGYKDMWYRMIEGGHPPSCVGNALVHHFEGRTKGHVKGRDFKSIEEDDRKRFKEKWGKTNSKQLLRQMKTPAHDLKDDR